MNNRNSGPHPSSRLSAKVQFSNRSQSVVLNTLRILYDARNSAIVRVDPTIVTVDPRPRATEGQRRAALGRRIGTTCAGKSGRQPLAFSVGRHEAIPLKWAVRRCRDRIMGHPANVEPAAWSSVAPRAPCLHVPPPGAPRRTDSQSVRSPISPAPLAFRVHSRSDCILP